MILLLVRLNRVNDIICESQSRVQPCLSQYSLTHNSRSTSARSLHAAHNSHARMSHARCVVNSEGDTEDGGRLSCVYGETKSLSTCTRTGVRRPAVEKLASPQQASLKLHDEMWAGLPMNLGPRIFREVEIIPGCAVRVACPSCPDYYPEPPGPGRKQISLWYGCCGVPSKERIFFLSLVQQETGKGKGRTTQRGRSLVIPHVLVHMRMDMAPLPGHTLDCGVGHCLPVCGGLSHPQ